MPDSLSTRQQHDEIDLVELFQKLWGKKYLIAGITLLVTIIAVTYALLASPVYRVQVATTPPSLSDIAGFNVARGSAATADNAEDAGSERSRDALLKPFSSKDIYAVFTRNLISDQSKRAFYRQVYLPKLDEEQKRGSQDALYQSFLKRLSVTASTPAQPDRFVLNVEGRDPAEAAQWAQQYIDEVAQRSLQEVLNNAQSEIAVRHRSLERQIEAQRESARMRREDRAVQLNEAFMVAQAIGLENPPMIAGQMSDQLTAIMEGSLSYMRGTKALRAEIEALTNRSSDDPFIPGLRNLQEQSALYSSVEINPAQVAVFRLDGAVETPDQPIKPKKALIVALGVVLGLMLGVFVALIAVICVKCRS